MHAREKENTDTRGRKHTHERQSTRKRKHWRDGTRQGNDMRWAAQMSGIVDNRESPRATANATVRLQK